MKENAKMNDLRHAHTVALMFQSDLVTHFCIEAPFKAGDLHSFIVVVLW